MLRLANGLKILGSSGKVLAGLPNLSVARLRVVVALVVIVVALVVIVVALVAAGADGA